MNVHFPEADLELCFQTLCNAAELMTAADPSYVTIVDGNDDPEHARTALQDAALDWVRELILFSTIRQPVEYCVAAHTAVGVIDQLEQFL